MKSKICVSLILISVLFASCESISVEQTEYDIHDETISDTEISEFPDETIYDSIETPQETVMTEPFPIEDAKKALIVAMTNCQSSDVFEEDGNTYAPSKFHNYSDSSVNGYKIYKDGTWSIVDDTTWNIEDFILESIEWGSYLRLSTNISFDGNSYTLSNGERFIGNKKHIESEDKNFVDCYAFSIPKDTEPYLIVSTDLIN